MVWLRRAFVALAALLLLAGFGWVGAQRALGPRVAIERPLRRSVVQTVVSSGRVLSPGEVNLGSTVGGVVRAVHVRDGDRVVSGQPLVDFDDEELLAQVAQARAGVLVASARVDQLRAVGARVAGESVRQAETNLRAAQRTNARQEILVRSGAIAQAEYESAQRALELARSQLQSAEVTAAGATGGGGDVRVAVANRVQAQAALRVSEARAGQARVRAPAAGVIMRRSVEPGDVVSPGRTLLVLLLDGPVELSVTPDERNLAELRVGQRALASAEAFGEQRFAAEVWYLAPSIDAQRGTVEVRLRVPDPPAYLRPAMTVSVEIEVARGGPELTLPAGAIRDAATRAPWVMVVGGDGRTARRDVALGLRGDSVVAVTRGLREADRVVSASALAGLTLGQHVRPTEPSAAAQR